MCPIISYGSGRGYQTGQGRVLDWALLIVQNRLAGGQDLGIHLLSQIDSFCDVLVYAAEDGIHVVQTVAMFLHRDHLCCLVVP